MDREKCKVKFSGSLLSGICLWMVCLLFMPGTAKSQSEPGYRTDAEYLLSKIMVSIPSAVEIHTNPLKICSDHTPMFENPTDAADNYHLDQEGVFL